MVNYNQRGANLLSLAVSPHNQTTFVRSRLPCWGTASALYDNRYGVTKDM